jgi:hypothetical protein
VAPQRIHPRRRRGPLAPDDAAGRRRPAEYLLRAPFSLEKITYNPATGSVLYRSERHWRTRRNFEVFSAPEFIAALLVHLPPKGIPQVRYYGWYSNKSRGQRERQERDAAGPSRAATPPAPPRPARRRRTAWRELIRQVWGADPLHCPLCSGLLRPIAVVETAAEIHAVLAPLGLARPHERPFTGGPPPPELTALIGAESGATFPADLPRIGSRLPYPRPRAEPLRYRAELMAPGEDLDQTGFKLPPAPEAEADAIGQGQLFTDDCVQPDAADGEPIFWSERSPASLGFSAAQKPDDCIQADAPDSPDSC